MFLPSDVHRTCKSNIYDTSSSTYQWMSKHILINIYCIKHSLTLLHYHLICNTLARKCIELIHPIINISEVLVKFPYATLTWYSKRSHYCQHIKDLNYPTITSKPDGLGLCIAYTLCVYSFRSSVSKVSRERRYSRKIFSHWPYTCIDRKLWWPHTVTSGFPSQRPVTRSFDIFFDLCLNKRLSKQSRRWWFETPLRSLWYHCNGGIYITPCHLWTMTCKYDRSCTPG